MCEPVKITSSLESAHALVGFLNRVDSDFSPPLSVRVNLSDYVDKLLTNAEVFGIYDSSSRLVGAFAVYANDHDNYAAYVSFIATDPLVRGMGIGRKLMLCMVSHCRDSKMKSLKLEVSRKNQIAIELYRKFGFQDCPDQQWEARADALSMILILN
jgi:ribosomal protein S18 acetylase RimI-like enzyme